MTQSYDYDWIVIGSGFGGSIAALRLAERGYSVGVLECGQRFTTENMPKTAWNLRRFLWMPKLGLKGMLRITNFKDVSIISGSAVGGGSVVYAQTLYRATDKFRDAYDQSVGEHVDLDPYYDVAERMLGVTVNPRVSSRDKIMIAAAEDLGLGAGRFHQAPVGVYFGEPGKTVPDPYFGGLGPDRAGCTACGGCLTGCKHNAKNSLDKNYLHLAERRGVHVMPGRLVTDVEPLGAEDGSDGYAVTSERPGAWVRKQRNTLRSRGVVVAAGPLGTNQLLAACKHNGSLPRLSDRIGHDVRTNAESVSALTLRDRKREVTDGVTISGSLLADDDLHIEAFTYGGIADSMGGVMVPLSGDGSKLTRPLKLLRAILLHPIDFLRSANPIGWSKHTIMIGSMWTRDGALTLRSKRRWFGKGVKLRSHQDPNNPNPTFIPKHYEFTKYLARQLDAIPQIWATEPFARPFTAHFLGGSVIATDPSRGVVDPRHRVFGYENLLVTDGAAMPFNPGVNPSLTIAALAERALSTVAAKDGSVHRGGIGYLPARNAAVSS